MLDPATLVVSQDVYGIFDLDLDFAGVRWASVFRDHC